MQTVNNYFLFSLACADLIIGLGSMNLYTLYIVMGHWPLGPVVCDLWLAVDYVVSNASVMNLLIISFDRYFCVTKPLSYPARRSTKMAGLMIAAAWVLSFILWAPAILFWQFVVGGRTVPPGQCYIQFFSNATVTFGTAIAAFYLPVGIMIALYWRISRASRSRVRKSRRKPSGTSLGEGLSQSQDGGGEVQPNNCTMTRDEEEEGEDRRKEREMVQRQPNGRGLRHWEGVETRESSTNESSTTVSIPMSNHREEENTFQTKPKQAQRSTQNPASGCGSSLTDPSQTGPRTQTDSVPAKEKQNLVTRTLLKVTNHDEHGRYRHELYKKANFGVK